MPISVPEDGPLSRNYNISECVLKFLCEGGTNRDSSGHEDFITELIHLLLTPEDILNHLPDEFNQLGFVEAQKFGSKGGNCDEKYKNCPTQFFEYSESEEDESDMSSNSLFVNLFDALKY